MIKSLQATFVRRLLIFLTAVIVPITDGGVKPARAVDDAGDLLNYSFALTLNQERISLTTIDRVVAGL